VQDNGALGNIANGISFSVASGTLRLLTAFDVSARTITLGTGITGNIDTNGNDVTFANSIGNSGAGKLGKSGAGKLTLTTANAYSGGTTINAGTLEVQTAANGLGTGTGVALLTGTLSLLSDSTTAFTGGGNAYVITVDNAGSTTGTINVDRLTGAGANNVLTVGDLRTANSSGTTIINITGGNGYSLQAGKLIMTGTSSGQTTLSPGSARVALTGVESATNSATTVNLGGTAVGNTITGSINETGSGVLSVAVLAGADWTLSGDNSVAGGTTTVTGTLSVGAANNFTAGALKLESGSTLNLLNDTGTSFAKDLSNTNGGTAVINVDRAIGGTGTGQTHTLGNVSFTKNSGTTLTVTGGNGYGLNVGTLTTGPGSTGNPTYTVTNNAPGLLTIADAAINRGGNPGNANTLQFNGTGNILVTGAVSQITPGTPGSARVSKSGNNTVTLSGNNTYTSTTTVSGGKLILAGDNTGATGATTVSGGILQLNTVNALSGGIGVTGGAAFLDVTGGIIGLGANDFMRTTSTSGIANVRLIGTSGFAAYGADRLVNLGGAGASQSWTSFGFMTASGTLVLGAADATHTVDFQNAINLVSANRTIRVDNGAADVDGKISGVISSTVAASGSLTKTGAGTLSLTGANTYGGGTNVNVGTLTVGTGGTLGATTGALAVHNPNTGVGTDVVLNLATAVDTTTGSLSGAIATPSGGTNTATINNGGVGRNFTVNQTSAGDYAGVIAGAGTFTLGASSTNALTLSGANTYTGATSIAAGTLIAANAAALGTNAADTTIMSGATLDVQANIGTEAISVEGNGVGGNGALVTGTGAGTVGGAVTLTNDAKVGGAGSLTIAGAIGGAFKVTKVGAGTTTLSGAQNYTTLATSQGVTNVSGAFTGGTATVIANATTNFIVSQTLAALNIGTVPLAGLSAAPAFIGGGAAVVPEPGSAVALLGGFSMLLGLQRFRRSSSLFARRS